MLEKSDVCGTLMKQAMTDRSHIRGGLNVFVFPLKTDSGKMSFPK